MLAERIAKAHVVAGAHYDRPVAGAAIRPTATIDLHEIALDSIEQLLDSRGWLGAGVLKDGDDAKDVAHWIEDNGGSVSMIIED